jgi:hypothetical protein
MAAHTEANGNPVIAAYVQGLRNRATPYRYTIFAAMQKLLFHIQPVVKNTSTFSLLRITFAPWLRLRVGAIRLQRSCESGGFGSCSSPL